MRILSLIAVASVIALGASGQTTCLGFNCSDSESYNNWGKNYFDGSLRMRQQMTPSEFEGPERKKCVSACRSGFISDLARCERKFPKTERRSPEMAWFMKPAYDRCIREAQDESYRCLDLMRCPDGS